MSTEYLCVGWKECLFFVHTAPINEVERLVIQGDTATLRTLCHMRVYRPDEWREHLRDRGLVELSDVRTDPKARALELWRAGLWTIEDLSRETGLSRHVLQNMRRRVLRGATWEMRSGSPPAYRLMNR